MKLLLDEMYSPAIAGQLRDRGHDVIAVADRPALQGQSDQRLLEWCTAERRVLVTNNVMDFATLHREHLSAGVSHAGLIYTSDKRYPRAKAGIGSIVSALETLLAEDPPVLSDALWLR